MKRAIRIALICALALVGTQGISHASISDLSAAKYVWPKQFSENNTPNAPLGGYGVNIVDSFAQSGEGVSRLEWAGPGSSNNCRSLKDPTCTENAKKYGWHIVRVLPVCKSADDSEDCIESVKIIKADGTVQALENIETIKYRSWDADPSVGLGASTGPSTWSVDSKNDSGFLVTVAGDAGTSYDNADFSLRNFTATINSYKTVVDPRFGPMTWFINERGEGVGKSSGMYKPECVWTSVGACGYTTEFPDGSRVSLTLHVPSTITGWLSGRLKDPEVTINQMGNAKGKNRITIDALPVSVPLIQVSVPLAEATDPITKQFADTNCSDCKHGIQAVNTRSNGGAFDALNTFGKWIKDKSTVEIPSWSVSSFTGGGMPAGNKGSCIFDTKKLAGLVTTNSTAYEGNPPTFDGSTLNYKVAGVHYTSKGEVFQGVYDLLIRSENARCLYGFTSAPISASISVTSSKGEENIATTVFNEKDGWIHLGAYGFTFSNPTISVKLTQGATSPSPAKKPAVFVNCVKGKVTKKVSGTKCPAGYKKK